MDKRYILTHVLPSLRNNAELLKEKSRGEREVWLSAAIDALSQALPESSMLLEELRTIRKQYALPPAPPPAPSPAAPASLAAPSPGLAGDASGVNDQEMIARVVSVLDYAARINLEPLDVADQERLVHSIISRSYLNAWWFKTPAAILLAAAALVTTGVIQIQSLKLNIREETDRAIARSKAAIKATQDDTIDAIKDAGTESKNNVKKAGITGTDDVKKEAESEIKRINKSTSAHIDGLIKEKPPSFDWHINTLEKRIKGFEERIKGAEEKQGRLEANVIIVRNALAQAVKPTDRLPLEQLSALLGRSWNWFLGELAIVTCALLLLVWRAIYWLIRKIRGR